MWILLPNLPQLLIGRWGFYCLQWLCEAKPDHHADLMIAQIHLELSKGKALLAVESVKKKKKNFGRLLEEYLI
jgi:hypothetical protein